MKNTDYFDLLSGRCSLKKSVTLSLSVKYFFWPVTSVLSGWSLFFLRAVAGSPVDLTEQSLQSKPVTVSLFVLDERSIP